MAAAQNEQRWFQSRLSRPSANLTVLAGNDFANRIVAVFETAEEAKEAVDAHNARLNAKGPASAPTLPDLGSNNPCKKNAVNEQHRTTAPAVAPATVHDPLLALIDALKAEEAIVYAIEDDDECNAAVEARVDPIIDQILHETPPATTAAGAYAALERVHYGMSEAGPGVYDEALLKAAMAYLEGRA